MQPVLTTGEMRDVDARATKDSTPLEQLVERAGGAAAGEALRMLNGVYGRRIVVVAGPGNNGADGKVVARLLSRRGAAVLLLDAREAPRRLPEADLVLDAAFGTGFRGDYCAPDPAGAPVLAIDVPSGVDADTGEAGEDAVVATTTVTFGAIKPGLLLGEGRHRAGRLVVAPIGLPVPPASELSLRLVEDDDVVALVPARGRESHKWKSALAVVAGSPGMYGAPGFVSHAAARAGAGMVRLGIPGASPGDLPVSEAVSRSLPLTGFDQQALEGLERCKALVVGPGLGSERPTRASVRRLVSKAPVPVVVDADALTALGEDSSAAEVLVARVAETVLTPHEGEFARLAGSPPGPDRVGSARRLSARVGAIVLLKGSTTVVASPDGTALLVTTGTSRLATAGTGDILSGVIGAFIARGMAPAEAAAVAAHVHGRAAERGRPEGLVASDLPELVAAVLSDAAVERAVRGG